MNEVCFMFKKLTAAFISAILIISPFSAFAKTGVYLQDNRAVIVSDKELNGYAAAVGYNSDGAVISTEVTPLSVNGHSAETIKASRLGYGDRVFFIDKNLAPAEKAYTAPYQGESNYTTGKILLNTFPHGSDIFIDGARYEDDTTPAIVSLVDGWHSVSFESANYESFDFMCALGNSEQSVVSIGVNVVLPKTDKTITVNDSSPVSDSEVDFTDSYVTFREAVAIANNDAHNSYTIRFDNSVESVAAGSYNNINITAENLVIDGSSDREKPVKFVYSDRENAHPIILLPTENVTLYGIEFLDGSFSIRPDDNEAETQSYENIRVLECKFSDYGLFAFGGACKAAGTSASVNYKDLYFCANTLVNTDCFFAYSGDCDNSTADGIYISQNELDENSVIDVNCSDCNTWYIYGRQTQQGGLTSPETADGNTVKNVLISGNTGGRLRMSCAVGGNSNNTMENVVIRNNSFTDFCEFTCAQNNNVRNVGQEMHTSSNVMRNFVIAYNNEQYTDSRPASLASRLYVSRSEDGALEAGSQLYSDNNKMESFIIYRNTVNGVTEAQPDNTVDSDVDYTDLGEYTEKSVFPFKAAVKNEAPQGISYVSQSGNTFEKLCFFDNGVDSRYMRSEFKDDVKVETFNKNTYHYDSLVEGNEYAIIALKGTRDSYEFNSDSLLYMTQFTATGADVEFRPRIPCSDYKGEYVVLLTGNDGVINQPVVIDYQSHIHSYKLVSQIKPTCTSQGVNTYKCERCDSSYSEKTDKAAHTPVTDKAIEPTFRNYGLTAGSHCKVCGAVIVKQKRLNKLGAPYLTKLKKGKRRFTAQWKNVGGVDGYEIQYSVKKNMKSSKKKTVKKGTAKKLTVKKLKAGRKYYVRIRAYKIGSEIYVYS